MRIDLPNGWWLRFEGQLERADQTLTEFCSKSPMISSRTLARAQSSGWMTSKTLAVLARKLRFVNADALVAEWSESPERPTLTPLAVHDSRAAEERFSALSNAGLYDDALEVAKTALARAEYDRASGHAAHWADRVADAYRSMGSLRNASSFYARAWWYLQDALASEPSNFALRWQAARTRFGQIMVDDYLIRGAANDAYARFESLLRDSDALLADAPSELQGQLRVRQLHARRQQAEMLRMTGRYSEAVKAIREVTAAYPEAEYEPRAWAHLSEAGGLRLLGALDDATVIYERVEQFARDRALPGLLGSTLLRKASVLKMRGNRNATERCSKEASEIASQYGSRYRFMTIYAHLIAASGHVPDTHDALEQLSAAEQFGPLSADYLAVEWAHAALCRGELLRSGFGPRAEALHSFRTAFNAYERIECRWGIVRAWIGIRMTGGTAAALGPDLVGGLEGLDRQLFARYQHQKELERGALSVNLP